MWMMIDATELGLSLLLVHQLPFSLCLNFTGTRGVVFELEPSGAHQNACTQMRARVKADWSACTQLRARVKAGWSALAA